MEFDFTDPRTTPFVPMRCRGELPHLYKDGGSYFVTFRLWDAVVPNMHPIDKKVLHQWKASELAASTEPPLRLGSCMLERPDIAIEVQNALQYFDRQRYFLAAWCVMPNHVHAVFTAPTDKDASRILHSWKSYTAHQANKLLGRTGAFWERESFDHLIRDMEQFEAFVHYVEHNPVQAGFCVSPELWPYSSGSCGGDLSCGAGAGACGNYMLTRLKAPQHRT